MKKFLLLFMCFFGFVNVIYAECDNSELKNLNALSYYIKSSYEFNEDTGKFDVTFVNVPDELYIVSDFKVYNPSNGVVRVSDVEQGASIKYEIYSSSNAQCITQYLRVITVNTPYLNKFFGTSSCVGYENLNECNNKFLNYDLTDAIFNKRIKDEDDRRKNQQQGGNNKPNDNEETNDNVSSFDKIMDYLKEYYIPVLLVVVSSSVTFLICNTVYRKVKHGI